MVGVGEGVMVGVLVGVGVGVGELGIVSWELLVVNWEWSVVACGVWVWVGVGSWARAACLVMEGMGVETAAAWQVTRQRARMDIKQWAFRMGLIVADDAELSSIGLALFGVLSLLPNNFLCIICFVVNYGGKGMI
jgi:hypothetical protein